MWVRQAHGISIAPHCCSLLAASTTAATITLSPISSLYSCPDVHMVSPSPSTDHHQVGKYRFLLSSRYCGHLEDGDRVFRRRRDVSRTHFLPIAFADQPLQEGHSLVIEVETVIPAQDTVADYTMTLGVVTCDPHMIRDKDGQRGRVDVPNHKYLCCRSQCGASADTLSTDVQNCCIREERIMMRRRNGEVIVTVRGEDRMLADPDNSFITRPAYPFILLNGYVEAVRIIDPRDSSSKKTTRGGRGVQAESSNKSTSGQDVITLDDEDEEEDDIESPTINAQAAIPVPGSAHVPGTGSEAGDQTPARPSQEDREVEQILRSKASADPPDAATTAASSSHQSQFMQSMGLQPLPVVRTPITPPPPPPTSLALQVVDSVMENVNRNVVQQLSWCSSLEPVPIAADQAPPASQSASTPIQVPAPAVPSGHPASSASPLPVHAAEDSKDPATSVKNKKKTAPVSQAVSQSSAAAKRDHLEKIMKRFKSNLSRDKDGMKATSTSSPAVPIADLVIPAAASTTMKPPAPTPAPAVVPDPFVPTTGPSAARVQQQASSSGITDSPMKSGTAAITGVPNQQVPNSSNSPATNGTACDPSAGQSGTITDPDDWESACREGLVWCFTKGFASCMRDLFEGNADDPATTSVRGMTNYRTILSKIQQHEYSSCTLFGVDVRQFCQQVLKAYPNAKTRENKAAKELMSTVTNSFTSLPADGAGDTLSPAPAPESAEPSLPLVKKKKKSRSKRKLDFDDTSGPPAKRTVIRVPASKRSPLPAPMAVPSVDPAVMPISTATSLDQPPLDQPLDLTLLPHEAPVLDPSVLEENRVRAKKRKQVRSNKGQYTTPSAKAKKKTPGSRIVSRRCTSPVRNPRLWEVDLNGPMMKPEAKEEVKAKALIPIQVPAPVTSPEPRTWFSNQFVSFQDQMVICNGSANDQASRNYIFGPKFRLRETIRFEIIGIDFPLQGSLAFGLTKQDPRQIDLSSLPFNPKELQGSKSTTSPVVDNVINRPFELGDNVILRRTAIGIRVTVEERGIKDEVIIRVPFHAQGYFPFLCFNGSVSTIQMIESEEKATVKNEVKSEQ